MTATFSRFEELNDENFFVALIRDYFRSGFPRLAGVAGVSVTIDDALITLAFRRYHINLQQYVVALNSKNPDHYKRAACLWHALYLSPPIVEVAWSEATKRFLDPDAVGVSHHDHQFWSRFTGLYEDHCNRMMAFDLAFRCCQVYETDKKTYNQDYLDNICYYMAENTNINVGSFMMILRSYMANGH